MDRTEEKRLLALTTAIVTGFVAARPVAPEDLPALIERVYEALSGVAHPHTPAPPAPPRARAQVRARLRPRGFVSLQDRRTNQLLRDHRVR